MTAALQEGLSLDPQREAIAMRDIAALKVRVARLAGLDVGDRVVVAFSAEARLHGVVYALDERAGVRGAWVNIIGHSAWYHFAPLADIHPVCGLCEDCLRLNERPACGGVTR